MSDKYLVYLTAWRATVYASRGGTLALAQSFTNDEDGYGAFATHLKTLKPSTLVYVLADVVEEDFHLDTIPMVRGNDRRQLVGRRLAQRYRDTSLSLALPLGIERGTRRDERLLLSSFTNTQIFEPWLNVLRQSDLAIAGVYSVALIAPLLAQRLGYRKGHALLVTLQPAGLRQTLVRDGDLRFSRLGPLEPAEAEQPTRVAAAFAGETLRIYQYLTAVRVLPRDEAALDVLLLAPPGRRALVQAAASDSAQLRYRVMDVTEAAEVVGLRALPPGAGAEAIYLHLLAQHPPRDQYLGERHRTNYRLLQAKRALLATGAFVLSACAMVAAFRWWNIYDVRAQAEAQRSETRSLNDTYERVTQGFPKIPTTVDNLKLTLQQYGALLKHTGTPDRLLEDLSSALGASPSVQVEKLRWEQGVSASKYRVGPEAPAGAAGSTTASAPPAAATPAIESGPTYEVIELSARITGIAVNDYRGVANAVNEFVDRLRTRPGVEVLARKLPFDIGSETSLSGDVGAAATADAPSFQVTLGRRLAL